MTHINQYGQFHKQECYSGTAPWNKCFCEPPKREVFKCKCGKQYGTKQGLKVHKWTNHRKE